MGYRLEDLRVETAIIITTIHTVQIEQNVNGHARLTMSGFCEEKGIQSMMSGKEKIILKDKEGNPVFAGIVYGMEKREACADFSLKAYSYTHELDREKRKRVFQRPGMTYESVIGEVLGRYENASFKDMITEGRKIPPIIVQFQETDWEFLVRLASHFGEGVCADCREACIRLFFGFPEADEEEIGGREVLRRVDLANGRETVEIANRSWNDAGRKVIYQQSKYLIRQTQAVMEKGELLHKVLLERSRADVFPYASNMNIAGVRLEAVAEEIQRNTIRLRFLVEEGGMGDTPYFPYEAEVNNEDGFYMPEPGEQVEVLFPDVSEENAFVMSAKRPVLGFTGTEVSMKYIRNKEGRELYMDGEKVRVSAGNKNSGVEMYNIGELVIEAPETMHISAGADLELGAGLGKTVLRAGKGIALVSSGNGRIWLDEKGNVNCRSSKYISYVKREGAGAEKEHSTVETKMPVSRARGSVMAVAGTAFLAESITGVNGFSGARKVTGRLLGLNQERTDDIEKKGQNLIKEELLQNSEELFREFSYGENKNG